MKLLKLKRSPMRIPIPTPTRAITTNTASARYAERYNTKVVCGMSCMEVSCNGCNYNIDMDCMQYIDFVDYLSNGTCSKADKKN